MKITPLGAAGDGATGSANVVRTERANGVIDRGLFQGECKFENFNRLPR